MKIGNTEINAVELPNDELESFDMLDTHFVIEDNEVLYTVPRQHLESVQLLYTIVKS